MAQQGHIASYRCSLVNVKQSASVHNWK